MTETHRWFGGRIYTGHRWAEALLVEGDRVVAVGTEAEVRSARPTGAIDHDLAGGMLLPGLVDAHLHLGVLVVQERGVDLTRASTLEEIVERTARWAGDHPRGPIVGRGWAFPSRPESEWPHASDLDRIDSERPIVLYHVSGHAAAVNTAALGRVGVGGSTPDPPGGRIGRSKDGRPNGQLFESALQPALAIADELLEAEGPALANLLHRLAALGITAVGTLNTDSSELHALGRLSHTGPLPVRVRSFVGLPYLATHSDVELRRRSAEKGRLRIAGVKGFADGAFGTRTAWLTEPYADDPENSGMGVHSVEELARAFDRARRLDLIPAVHALGDRGIASALDALERSRGGSSSGPDRLDHAGLLSPELLDRVATVRPVAVVQPIFVWSDGWMGERLGPGRQRWAYPFGSLLRRGVELAGSSDAPFDSVDPWRGIAAFVRRTSPDGQSANPSPEEEIPLSEAIHAYTRGGARALGDEDAGELRPGALADFVIVGASDLATAVEAGAGGVRETWVGGTRSYGRPRGSE